MLHLNRRRFLATAAVAGAALFPAARRLAAGSTDAGTPAVAPHADYHVHLSQNLTIEQAVALAKSRGLQFGIVDHPGKNVGGYRQIENDEQLSAYIAALRAHPVAVGLQPVLPGWSKSFSAPVLAQLDYILMDALTMPDGAGGWMYLWAPDVFIEDDEAFMDRYVAFIHELLSTERMDIFAWPTYLPTAIARDYERLWTKTRRDGLIDHLRERAVAVEINEIAHVPDAAFILRARSAGLKFTCGSDARSANAGRFSYCHRMIQACALADDDFRTINRRA